MAKNKLIEQPKEVEVKVEEVKAEEVEVKPIEAEIPVEVKGFKNVSDKGIKIKLIDGKKFSWITVKPGDIVTIPAKIAKANNLTRVE